MVCGRGRSKHPLQRVYEYLWSISRGRLSELHSCAWTDLSLQRLFVFNGPFSQKETGPQGISGLGDLHGDGLKVPDDLLLC